MNIHIRKATIDDWNILQKLNNEVFESEAAHDKDLDLKWPFSDVGIARYKQLVSDPRYCTLIAFDGEISIGHIACGPNHISHRLVKIAEISELGVSASYRSFGIGAQLVTHVRTWCKEQGYQKLMVNAYSKNTRGIRFYQKQGFEPIDTNLEMDI